MSLKELTKTSHTNAEKTEFMKAVFKNKMPLHIWADFLYQKSLFYNAIESCAIDLGLIDYSKDFKRSFLLLNDSKEIIKNDSLFYNDIAVQYYQYIMNLYPNQDKILAHVYTWHMGDLHGGQIIKKLIDAPHSHLDFDNKEMLIFDLRSKIHEGLADEANIAFDWAIRLMKYYENDFDF